MEITSIEPLGNSTFKGTGTVQLGIYGAGIRANLNNIKVNSQFQLVAGTVEAIKGQEVAFLGKQPNAKDGIGAVDFTNPNSTQKVDGTIDNVERNDDGTWTITLTDGQIVTLTPDPNGGTLVVGTDGNGVVIIDDTYRTVTVDKDGKIITTDDGTQTGGGTGTAIEPTSICSQTVTFAPAAKLHSYGFDPIRPGMPQSYYHTLRVGDNTLTLPWKSVARGASDRLLATPKGSNLKFAYQSGLPLQPSDGPDGHHVWTLNPPGGEDNLLALCTDDAVAGGVRVVTYPPKRHRVAVVPVNGAKPMFTQQELQRHLNTIYAQAATEWEVVFEEPITLPQAGGVEVPSTDYSPSMRDVWQHLKGIRNPNPTATYLFIVPSFTGQANMRGYMPLRSGYGFLTPTATPRDAAHELGHGVFNLRHTFSSGNIVHLSEGTTGNLMDYGQGEELWKYQWDFIHNPQGGWFVWEDSEEGAALTDAYARYVIVVYSPYISDKIVKANDTDSKVALIGSRLNDSFTQEQVNYINTNRISDLHSSQYFEIPSGNPIATMKINQQGTGVIMYLVEKNDEDKFVLNRYTAGTHTDIIKRKLSKLNEFDFNINYSTPTDFLLQSAKLLSRVWNGVIKFGGTIEVKGGVTYGGALAFSFGHAIDPDENLAVYGTMAGFLSMCESLTVSGNPSSASGDNMYILGGGSVTADLGFTKYRHVYELAGVVKQYDIDASIVDATIEVGRYNEFQGITISLGVGLDAGFGVFSSTTIVWAYTKQDLTNAFNAYLKMKYIYNEHVSLGRNANIVSNVYVNGVKIQSLTELLNPDINEIYYSFDVYDPDEDDVSSATPLQSIVLVKFIKPNNSKPYYRTLNVTPEPQ